MRSFMQYLQSSVGRKKAMGLSGLGLSLFVLMHMAGNLLMLVSPDAYNKYGHQITHSPLLYVIETLLCLGVLVHVGFGIQLSLENKLARPVGYAAQAYGNKKTSLVAKTLILSGALLLTFLVLHLITFKYGPVYLVQIDGVEVRDLYKLVTEKFQEPGYVAWYLVSLAVMGAHLSHGIKASFQSLGVASAKNKTLTRVCTGLALLVTLGFMSQPLYIFFTMGGR